MLLPAMYKDWYKVAPQVAAATRIGYSLIIHAGKSREYDKL